MNESLSGGLRAAPASESDYSLPIFDFDPDFIAVAPDFRNVHRSPQRGKSVELARHFSTHRVADFPYPLLELVDEESHFAIAKAIASSF